MPDNLTTSGTADSASIRMRYYVLVFAGVNFVLLYGYGAFRAFTNFRLPSYGSLPLLFVASLLTVWLMTSRLQRALTTAEVGRLSVLCFVPYWIMDDLIPFLYRWRTSGEPDFHPLQDAIAALVLLLFAWCALALSNGILGGLRAKPPVA